MLTKKLISIVPVAYGDEGNIEELYKRVTKVMKNVSPNYEIVYINDASPDKSQEVLEKLAKKDKRLTVITHSRNFGLQNAFTSGMTHAIGDAVLIMDGDLQDPPELIPQFVQKWLEGFDVVFGIRAQREGSYGKNWEKITRLFYKIVRKWSYIKIPLDAGEFSLMDRKVIDLLGQMPERDRFIRILRAWVGFKQVGIPYARPERFSGISQANTNIIKKLYWVRKAIINSSFKPLEWVLYLSIITAFVSVSVLVINLVTYFVFPNTPRGYLTLLTAILFIGSVQLISISIICEYLIKIFEEVKNRPLYIVEKIINNHKLKK